MTRTPHVRKDTAQTKRFIEAAREAGCSEDETGIPENMRRIASAKVDKLKGEKK